MSKEQIEQRITAAAEKAQQAFWSVIAAEFPEATTGDLSPEVSSRLDAAIANAVESWVMWNVEK